MLSNCVYSNLYAMMSKKMYENTMQNYSNINTSMLDTFYRDKDLLHAMHNLLLPYDAIKLKPNLDINHVSVNQVMLEEGVFICIDSCQNINFITSSSKVLENIDKNLYFTPDTNKEQLYSFINKRAITPMGLTNTIDLKHTNKGYYDNETSIKAEPFVINLSNKSEKIVPLKYYMDVSSLISGYFLFCVENNYFDYNSSSKTLIIGKERERYKVKDVTFKEGKLNEKWYNISYFHSGGFNTISKKVVFTLPNFLQGTEVTYSFILENVERM